MTIDSLTLTVTVDRDWVRLAAYRMVLQQIADGGSVPSWERDDDEAEPHEIAEAVLRALDDWEGDP
jgi:hypothetical protein